jgi:indole-3-glycerol phosphate synthase
LILDRILATTRETVAASRRAVPSSRLPLRTVPLRAGVFASALRGPGVSVVAEIKRKSPSKGLIREDFDPSALARAYAEAGVAAISCLTDVPYFGGSLEHLALVKRETDIPLLRKDFIVDDYQLDEAVAYGADAVLLIVAALGARELASLLAEAGERGLSAVVEAHTVDEARLAIDAGAQAIGVNNRDLRTFEVDLAVTERVAASLPAGERVLVSESGIGGPEDLARLAGCGVDAVLVGESLMRATDVRAAAASLVAAGRSL